MTQDTSAESFSQPPFPEGFPQGESLFPFRVTDLQALHDRLMTVTTDDLRSFIAVRKDGGRADSMVTALYGARLGSGTRQLAALRTTKQRFSMTLPDCMAHCYVKTGTRR